MKIYTKTGDNLETSAVKRRVYKSDVVIHAVGSADELAAALMVSYHFIEDEKIKEIILGIVKEIINVSADIIGYGDGNLIKEDRITYFESLIDEYTNKMPKLTQFIVPGLNKGSSHLHLARAVSRRLERWVVEYAQAKEINKNILVYLNRLSDLLFTLARYLDQ